MDVTGRTESDPAAETLSEHLAVRFRLESGRRPEAIYVGRSGREAHLEHAGIAPGPTRPGSFRPTRSSSSGRAAGKTLAADARPSREFMKAGGKVLALGLDQEEANSSFRAGADEGQQEHISTFFEPFGADSLLAGIGPADVHNRGARHLRSSSGGEQVVGDGVLAKAQDANVVFCQLPPYAITSAEGAVQSFHGGRRRRGGTGSTAPWWSWGRRRKAHSLRRHFGRIRLPRQRAGRRTS